MKNDFLKGFELKNIEKVAKECQETANITGAIAIVPIEADTLMRMVKEIKRRRFLSNRYWRDLRKQVKQ